MVKIPTETQMQKIARTLLRRIQLYNVAIRAHGRWPLLRDSRTLEPPQIGQAWSIYYLNHLPFLECTTARNGKAH